MSDNWGETLDRHEVIRKGIFCSRMRARRTNVLTSAEPRLARARRESHDRMNYVALLGLRSEAVASFYGIWNICKQVSSDETALHIWRMTRWLGCGGVLTAKRQARPAAAAAAYRRRRNSCLPPSCVSLSGPMPIIICENL